MLFLMQIENLLDKKNKLRYLVKYRKLRYLRHFQFFLNFIFSNKPQVVPLESKFQALQTYWSQI